MKVRDSRSANGQLGAGEQGGVSGEMETKGMVRAQGSDRPEFKFWRSHLLCVFG